MKSRQAPVRWQWRFLFFYAALLGLLLVAAAGILEIGVRVFVPEKYWRYCAIEDDWQNDKEIGWVHKPNLDVENRADGKTLVRFQTNPDGLQPASAKEKKSRFRVMLFGDSTVVGRPLPEDQRLASQLEREFAAKGVDCEVICAGVQGYSTDQSLLLMRRLLPRYRPDVVVHMVCENDFGGNESDDAYGLPKPRFVLNATGELALRQPSPEAIAAAWEKSRNDTLQKLVQRIAIYRMAQPGIQYVRAKSAGWQQQNLIGGLGGDNLEVLIAHADWPLFEAMIAAMKAVCRENGAAFVMTQHPSLGEVWSDQLPPDKRRILEERLARTAQKIEVDFCPVLEFFERARAEGPFHLLPRDGHCNAKGYEVTARCLAACLAKKDLAPRSRAMSNARN